MDAIVSVTSDWAIGKAGGLLVPNRADMRRFVQLTRGCTVLMGREDPRELPGGRSRAAATWWSRGRRATLRRGSRSSPRRRGRLRPRTLTRRSGSSAGASIYQALLDKCERAYVTVNECVREADAWFPNLDESPDWEVEAREKGGVTEAGRPV